MPEFCHLHCHTQYSLLDGAARIKKLVGRAAEMEIPALAITDHGNLFGVPEFYTYARREGVQPIIGCEFYVTPSGMGDTSDRTRYHQVLLAKNEAGYRNLIKLSSMSYTDGFYYKPRIDRDTLRAHSEGLVATTCCLQGEVLQTILKKGEDEGLKVFKEYLDIFGEDYYIEIQDHGIPDQQTCNAVLLRWAEQFGVRVVATNDVHYVHQDDAAAQDVLLCLQTGRAFNDPNRMRFENDQFFLKSMPQMQAAFAAAVGDTVVVDRALDTTREIADKCTLELDLGTLLMPHFPIPESFDAPSAYLRHLVFEGAKMRYGGAVSEPVRERLDYELAVIAEMGYDGYFLIVQDFTTAARDLGVSVGPGRGSAAGSCVAYCLGITNIDPLEYDLLFERFLNPERVSMPDIDIDFDDRGRARVIDYVVEKYGRESVCQIVTFGTMGSKSVIRDVARVLDLPLTEADRIAKLIPDGVKVSLDDARKEVREFAKLYESPDPQVRKLMHYASVLEGSARHTGVHAAGVIIAPGDVSQYVPVSIQKGKGGAGDAVVTQYDGKWIEEFGLLKMDFLGLKTLTVLDDALALIKEGHGVEIDLDTLGLDDPETYKLFQRGETVGVFQFESEGMREWMRKLRPTGIDDLIAMNALYRPGPMDLIPTYIDRKHGKEVVAYPHPMLAEILEPTYGIPVYQEQVMQMAQTMGGYTLGGADLLRRAMGKKKQEEMDKQRVVFVEGAAQNEVNAPKANEVFDMMAKFAGYGFNKCAHAQTKVRLADDTKMTLARAYREQPDELMAMWPDGEIRPHRVSRIVKTGKKPLLKVTTESRRVIKVTSEHRLLTTEGYLAVEEMEVGTELITEPRPVTEAQRRARRATMTRINKRPAQRARVSKRVTAYQAARPYEEQAAHMRRMHDEYPDLTRNGVAAMHDRVRWLHANDPEWRKAQMQRTLASVRSAYDTGPGFGICSIASNGMWCASQPERDMCEWLIEQGIEFEMHKVLGNGRVCDFYFDGVYWEMDGMDREPAYFADKYGALPFVVVTPEDFRTIVSRHLALEHAENGDPIAQIESCGEAVTYDVEMAPNGPLNFIANGIVSHNSHSAAYSLVAYHTAYLKAHYPAEFMAAYLTNESGDSKKLAIALDEARRMGLALLPPCVNHSEHHFNVEAGDDGRQVRFGLYAVKGVGAGAIEAIVAERDEHGPYLNLFDFCKRVDLAAVNKSALEALAKAGAFDFSEAHRAQLAHAAEGAHRFGQQHQVNKALGQNSLFGGDGDSGQDDFEPSLPHVEPWTRGEQLRHEKDLVGFYVSGHPLDAYEAEVNAFVSAYLGRGDDIDLEREQKVCGIITEVKEITTKSGKPMAFLTLEDQTGQGEVVLFTKVFERHSHLLRTDEVVMVRGQAEVRGGVKIKATALDPMWKVREQYVKKIILRLDADATPVEAMDELWALCERNRGPAQLMFDVRTHAIPKPVRLRAQKGMVEPTPELMQGIYRLFGREMVMLEGEA
ncbi:MAG: DNA polymerase III subunit alpha [Bacteroidota bacterium]